MYPSTDAARRLINSMQAELDKLTERKAQLRRRMRGLRRMLKVFPAKPARNLASEPDCLKPRQPRRLRQTLKRAEGRESRQLCDKLKRACRIAFLEAGGTATPDEICSSIMRRNSFSFTSADEPPAVVIIRILNLMSQTGETQCVSSDQYSFWRYVCK